ncbi:MAG: DUF3168 domain-containing protein [Cereibacter sphaeroides]|uniref:DUF3168 domain-containing protein n=1 Tax=Cereibacter sphaeroides TaxID=1063 RepID=A0A2W5TUN0_CERSP|nr:MAG: DUF3168 domain-containing protein [Cereibacter sphaeroides]
MSYGLAVALQEAVFARLAQVPELARVAVVDALPNGMAGTFVLIGGEEVIDRSDQTGRGAEHRFVVSVVSDATGFQSAKMLGVAISDALADAPLVLNRGRLVGLWFQRAVARRLDEGRVRRIDLTFRARVEE